MSSRPKRETAADMTALVARLKQCAQTTNQSSKKTIQTPASTTTTHAAADNTAVVDAGVDTQHNACVAFVAGMKVEARDGVGDWYPSKVVEVSHDGKQCLVHFTRWSSRFDEWVPITSVRMRSHDGDSDGSIQTHEQEYEIGEQVYARWSDGRRYKAVIKHIFIEQSSALVVFDDNYRKKVKLNAISRININNNNNDEPITTTCESMVTPITPITSTNQCNDGFIKCGTCGKTFRKASLMLWHERHCNQTVDHVERSRKTNEQTVNKRSQQSTTTAATVTATTTTTTATRRTRRTKNGRRRRRRFTTQTQHSQPIVDNNECVDVVNVGKTTEQNVMTSSSSVSTQQKAVKRRRSSIRSDVTAAVPPITVNETVLMTPETTQTTHAQPNTRLPFWDAMGVAEQHESDDVPEVVHCCHCDEFEESGLMVQCDLCLAWQHAACVHYNSNCQHEYICGACRHPRLMRKTKKMDFSVSLLLKPNSRFRHNVFELDNNGRQQRTSHAVDNNDAVCLAHAFERVHDINEVISSLSARVAKLERNTILEENENELLEMARTQHKLQTVLNGLEHKINELEQSDTCSHDDAWIKMQTQLLFEDLKNARKICENQ